MQETATSYLASKLPALANRFGKQILSVDDFRGDLSFVVEAGSVKEIIRFLKEESSLKFEMMLDLFGMDYSKTKQEASERFAVVYILYSFQLKLHVRLKAFLPETKPEIDSIHDVYKAANWFEREAWDLFGITFQGHPNLVRILCHTDFVGHPMRKDYPSDRYQRLKESLPSTGI